MSGFDSRSWEVRWEPGALGVEAGSSFGRDASGVLASLRGLAVEVTDEDVEVQRAGNRGLMLAELRGILARCREQGLESPGDPRWDELALRALDRLAKLMRLYEVSGPRVREGDVDRVRMAQRVALDLEALEGKVVRPD